MITFADCKGGFPHSEIFGSQGARASPKLIAACHVFHRLSTPRHPSEALMRLIVLSKTHAWGRKMPPGRTKDRLAPTHALRFVFADNDVFSDPSSSFRGSRIDPSIHDVRLPPGPKPGRKHVIPDRAGYCGRAAFAGTGRQAAAPIGAKAGGARRDRTDDLMLAKHALYQLSYGPKNAIEAGPRELVVDLSVRPRFHTKCGGPRRTRTADLTLIRRVL